MDHFDEWTKTLARSTSRRDALKTLAGGTVGGLLALLGVGEAAADDTCKPAGKKCNKSSQCCPTTVANARATCNGTCGFTCNPGYKLCNGSCIPTAECCNCTGFCVNGTCLSCLPGGESGCTSSDDCCLGFCDDGFCKYCLSPGESGCTSNGDCCLGFCDGGTCRYDG
jgi:hypothetical protein